MASLPDRTGTVAAIPAFEEASGLVMGEGRRGYERETLARPRNGRPFSELDRCPAGRRRPTPTSTDRVAGVEIHKCQETEG